MTEVIRNESMLAYATKISKLLYAQRMNMFMLRQNEKFEDWSLYKS